MQDRFRRFAEKTCFGLGTVWAFGVAVGFILGWAVTGPIFAFSDTWQLTMNTVASVVAFLMVFVIQNTQNRDARSLHLKLDELLRADTGARKGLIHLEDLPDTELQGLDEQFRRLHDQNYDPRDSDGELPA